MASAYWLPRSDEIWIPAFAGKTAVQGSPRWNMGSHPHLRPLPSMERRREHPHLSPLPSRERRGSTLTSILSRRGRGGGSHPHLRPLPSMERRRESPSPQSSPVEGEEGEHPHLNPLPSRERRRESPSPQTSPVEEEEAGATLTLRRGSGQALSPLPSMERREPAPSRIILPALQAYFEWRLHYVRQATDGLWLQPADG